MRKITQLVYGQNITKFSDNEKFIRQIVKGIEERNAKPHIQAMTVKVTFFTRKEWLGDVRKLIKNIRLASWPWIDVMAKPSSVPVDLEQLELIEPTAYPCDNCGWETDQGICQWCQDLSLEMSDPDLTKKDKGKLKRMLTMRRKASGWKENK